MTLEQAMCVIEGHEFAAEANLASGSKAFYSGLRKHPAFRELLGHIREPNAPETMLRRSVELASRPVDRSIENPFDTALTAYLTALDLQNSELIGRAAEAVSKATNCWWAAEISSRILARVSEGQMPLAVFHPGVNASALGADPETPSSPRPTYRPRRPKEGHVSGHRRRRLASRAVA